MNFIVVTALLVLPCTCGEIKYRCMNTSDNLLNLAYSNGRFWEGSRKQVREIRNTYRSISIKSHILDQSCGHATIVTNNRIQWDNVALNKIKGYAAGTVDDRLSIYNLGADSLIRSMFKTTKDNSAELYFGSRMIWMEGDDMLYGIRAKDSKNTVGDTMIEATTELMEQFYDNFMVLLSTSYSMRLTYTNSDECGKDEKKLTYYSMGCLVDGLSLSGYVGRCHIGLFGILPGDARIEIDRGCMLGNIPGASVCNSTLSWCFSPGASPIVHNIWVEIRPISLINSKQPGAFNTEINYLPIIKQSSCNRKIDGLSLGDCEQVSTVYTDGPTARSIYVENMSLAKAKQCSKRRNCVVMGSPTMSNWGLINDCRRKDWFIPGYSYEPSPDGSTTTNCVLELLRPCACQNTGMGLKLDRNFELPDHEFQHGSVCSGRSLYSSSDASVSLLVGNISAVEVCSNEITGKECNNVCVSKDGVVLQVAYEQVVDRLDSLRVSYDAEEPFGVVEPIPTMGEEVYMRPNERILMRSAESMRQKYIENSYEDAYKIRQSFVNSKVAQDIINKELVEMALHPHEINLKTSVRTIVKRELQRLARPQLPVQQSLSVPLSSKQHNRKPAQQYQSAQPSVKQQLHGHVQNARSVQHLNTSQLAQTKSNKREQNQQGEQRDVRREKQQNVTAQQPKPVHQKGNVPPTQKIQTRLTRQKIREEKKALQEKIEKHRGRLPIPQQQKAYQPEVTGMRKLLATAKQIMKAKWKP